MNDLFKESGKYLFDISKILLTIAVVTPLVKGGDVSIIALIGVILSFSIGTLLIYFGGENEL